MSRGRARTRACVSSGSPFIGLPQRLNGRELLELVQGVVFDLADAFAADAEGACGFLARVGVRAGEAEAQFEDLALAPWQRVERAPQALALERLDGGVARGF